MSVFRIAGIAAVSMLLSAGCTGSTASARPQAIAAPVRYQHEPDILKTVTPFLTPQGLIDPAFSAVIATPSRYLGDFFGMQAIADVTAAEIEHDLVPAAATVVTRDDRTLTLRMKAGYTATFFPRSSLVIKGAVVPISHVVIGGTTWREIRSNLANFRTTIQQSGQTKRYLLPNPFYRAEIEVAAQIRNGPVAAVTVDPELATYDRQKNAVLLVPEGVHGQSADADRLVTLLGRHKIDWLGMEMLSDINQHDLDAFNAAKLGTPAYAAARAKLVAYFADAWNGRSGPKTTGEANYYFKLVEAAHAAGVQVYGIEGGNLPFIIYRYGETSFGAAVRSLLWVRNAPLQGRGIIFGGSAHFKEPLRGRVQDFLVRRNPKAEVYSLVDLALRKQ